MALPKLFQRIFWHNNTTPAINEDNLNAISKAVDDIDDRVIELAGTIMEDVPEIQHDLEILEPAIENIDANVTRAENAADNAEAEALKSEGYALGTQDGVEVTSGEYYQNNAKYYAEIANPPIENTVDFTDVIAISDAINKAAKDVRLKVEAVQDLHGYTKPWVGGAGKNILPLTVDGIKAATTAGTWSGNTYNINNTTFEIQTDNANNVTGIKINTGTGGASAQAGIYICGNGSGIKIPGTSGQTLTMSGLTNGCVWAYKDNSWYGPFSNRTVSIGSADITELWIAVPSGGVVNNVILKPQLELGSTATAWEQYTNICPISGWDNAKVTRSGKNLYVGSPSFDGYSQISGWTKQTETYNGHDVYKRSGAWNGAYKIIYLPKGTYTFSAAVKTSDSGQVGIFAAMSGVTTAVMPLAQKVHIATSTSWSKISFTFSVTTAGTVALRVEKEAAGDIYISEYQLEAGATSTEYEPNNSEELTISLNGTRYGGTLDVTSGVLTVLWGVADLGDFTYTLSSETYPRFATTAEVEGIKKPTATSIKVNGLCEAFPIVKADDTYTGTIGLSVNAVGQLRIYAPTYSDASSFKTAMTGIKFIYELATPVTVQLTAEEVDLLYGYNTLFGDTGDISLTYDASGIIHIEEAKLDTETLKTIAAASSDFADFKARIAAL